MNVVLSLFYFNVELEHGNEHLHVLSSDLQFCDIEFQTHEPLSLYIFKYFFFPPVTKEN